MKRYTHVVSQGGTGEGTYQSGANIQSNRATIVRQGGIQSETSMGGQTAEGTHHGKVIVHGRSHVQGQSHFVTGGANSQAGQTLVEGGVHHGSSHRSQEMTSRK